MQKLMIFSVFAAATVVPFSQAPAQVAGETTLGVTVEQMKLVVLGWSAKKKLLGAPVYNDAGERIGKIEDIIVSPDRSVSHAIIGVGGFLGLIGTHDVAIPMDQIRFVGNRFVIPGATKAALKAMPEFHYLQ
jgi:sporulation protein YlmC with PRC-barrel domain